MCAFSPTDDIQVWCTKLPYEYEFTAPAALDGIVYLHGGGTPGFWQNSVVYSMSNMIVSYDISTGLPQWLDLPDYGDSYIPPIGVNGVMDTATTSGRVYGYSTADGG